MDVILFRTAGLLVVAILVAIIARRIHLPYTVGLVITGIVLVLARIDTGIVLTHELVFDGILPPLLFEAALNIRWSELRRDAVPVLTLATLGVVISALVVTIGTVGFLNWPMSSALVFGVLIAATDPVAVIAMFKDTGVKGRFRLLVESESLLNDGVAAVLFALVLASAQAASGDSTTPAEVAQALVLTAGGGSLVGLFCGAVGIALAGRTKDPLVETALTMVAAYGSFLLAEQLHVSGVLATVAAGLLMGNFGALAAREQHAPPSEGREFVMAFWEFAAFIANSLIFLLIGVTVAGMPFTALGWTALSIIVVLVLIGRALTVYPLCLTFARSRWAIPMPAQHLLWWGGLRGALALALALALPESLPLRNEIVIATFGVVVFSVVVQGVTMSPFLRILGLLPSRT
ncbi:MAG TPA: sodium:proton antiporter [Micropepsaceae bacterium]|nr:sodium:proton antiporter [Micropepsaceae bacterium]